MTEEKKYKPKRNISSDTKSEEASPKYSRKKTKGVVVLMKDDGSVIVSISGKNQYVSPIEAKNFGKIKEDDEVEV